MGRRDPAPAHESRPNTRQNLALREKYGIVLGLGRCVRRLSVPGSKPAWPGWKTVQLRFPASRKSHPLDAGSHSVLYNDETLNCIDCSRPFTFTAGEQQFFAAKGFQNKPNRCPDCRSARKAQRAAGGGTGGGGYSAGNGGGSRSREMFQAVCSQCGQVAEVPFQPRGDKPVYCRDCFQSRSTYR